MGVDSLPPHGLHQLLIWSVDNYHFESQIVIWATSLLFVPETPAHFIRWAVIHLGLSVEGGILAATTRTVTDNHTIQLNHPGLAYSDSGTNRACYYNSNDCYYYYYYE